MMSGGGLPLNLREYLIKVVLFGAKILRSLAHANYNNLYLAWNLTSPGAVYEHATMSRTRVS